MRFMSYLPCPSLPRPRVHTRAYERARARARAHTHAHTHTHAHALINSYFSQAFRTGSADEALEKTVVTAVESGEISSAVAGFVLPLGIDLNLDGSGIYYPLAVLYLGQVSRGGATWW